MEAVLLVSVLISILGTLIFLPKWIKKCREVGLEWKDMNKIERPKVAASGGLVVIFSFVIGSLYYVAVRTFILNNVNGVSVKIFALLSVILIMGLVGLTDDLLGWKKGGLSRRFRVFLTLVASVPLVVINAGVRHMNIPIIGKLNFGILYPLILVPIGIVGASTTYNFLAGFNGEEAGQGILILTFLSFILYINNQSWLSLIGLVMVGSLLVFYLFNKNPARVFPGDSLTYSIGAMIAIMAILGNMEKIAVFVFIPYILETGLKLRGKLKKYSFGRPREDNSLELKYNKIYSLNHLAIYVLSKFKEKVRERDVTYFIFSFQILIIGLAWLIFVAL